MFESAMRSQVVSVKPVLVVLGDTFERRIRLTFRREFDTEIAKAIGDCAVAGLAALQSRAQESAVFPITAVAAKATITAPGGQIVVPYAAGVKVSANAPPEPKGKKEVEEEQQPSAKLEFEMPFTDEAWLFLGKNYGAWCDFLLEKMQLVLPKVEEPAAAQTPAQKRQAAIDFEVKLTKPKRKLNMDTPPAADDDRDDAQGADSPEAAEAIRESRMAGER